MSDKSITRLSLAEARGATGLTDWDRLRREDATGIEPAEDDPEDGFDWMQAVVLERPQKKTMTIRVDEDVLAYFRSTGKGYQTRINAILRAWVEQHEGKRG